MQKKIGNTLQSRNYDWSCLLVHWGEACPLKKSTCRRRQQWVNFLFQFRAILMVLSWTSVHCSKKKWQTESNQMLKCNDSNGPMAHWQKTMTEVERAIRDSVIRTYHPISSQWKWGMREESYPIPTNLVSRNQTNKIQKSFFICIDDDLLTLLHLSLALHSYFLPDSLQNRTSFFRQIESSASLATFKSSFALLFTTAGTQVLNILSKEAIWQAVLLRQWNNIWFCQCNTYFQTDKPIGHPTGEEENLLRTFILFPCYFLSPCTHLYTCNPDSQRGNKSGTGSRLKRQE